MKEKLFIGIPAYGGVHPLFMDSFTKFMMEFSAMPVVYMLSIGDSLVCRARNNLAAGFMESDATHFLQLDTDLQFDPARLGEMVTRAEDVVGGLYPLKRPGPVAWCLNKSESAEAPKPGELMEVDYVGTGMLRVKRQVLLELIRRGMVSEYRTDNGEGGPAARHDFFPIGPRDGRYLSEDWEFCRLVKQTGSKVWVDPACTARHYGDAGYPI